MIFEFLAAVGLLVIVVAVMLYVTLDQQDLRDLGILNKAKDEPM